MGAGPITFDPAAWKLRYPEFVNVSDPLAQLYFNEATLYVDNTPCGPIDDVNTLTILLNMATAHVAWLNAPQIAGLPNDGPGSQPASPLVGRIEQATEGTVTVRAVMDAQPGSAAWWQQTKYGAAWWQATAQYRTAQYQPSPLPRFCGPTSTPWGMYGRRWW